jgi:putative alpha-1,2-mannosidase
MTGATSNSPISRLRKVHEGTAYTAYSIRDIYRAENSLLTLMAPERIDGIVHALLWDAEGGFMPKWPNPSYTNIMIATHADSLVAEAVAKGLGHRLEAGLRGSRQGRHPPARRRHHPALVRPRAGLPYEARVGLSRSKALGYIRADQVSGSASSTLEEAYDDYAVAQMAKVVGD